MISDDVANALIALKSHATFVVHFCLGFTLTFGEWVFGPLYMY